MKDVLRFALTISGGPCVMTAGVQMMLEWSALNSEYPPPQVQSSHAYWPEIYQMIISLYLQTRHCPMRTLVKEVVPFSWTMWLALEQKAPCSPATATELAMKIVVTMKMQE